MDVLWRPVYEDYENVHEQTGGFMKGVEYHKAVFAGMLCAAISIVVSAKVVDMDDVFAAKAAQAGLAKLTAATRTKVTEQTVSSLQEGDVLLLSRNHELGDVDFGALPDNVVVRYGAGGRIFLSGDKSGLVFMDIDAELVGGSKKEFLAKGSTRARGMLRNSVFISAGNIPTNDQDGNHYVDINSGKQKLIDLNGKTFTNCSGVWLRYDNLHDENAGPFIYMNNVNAQGSRLYGLIEHNYCVTKSSAEFRNVRGLTIGNGDTEGSASPTGCYFFSGCENFTFVAHRIFKSHSRECQGMAYLVNGNTDLRFYCTVDIGDNQNKSMVAKNNTDLKFFGSFFEEPVDLDGTNSNVLKMFYTPNGFGGAEKWREPAYIGEEIVIDYNNYTIDPQTTSADDPSVSIPTPPVVPSVFNENYIPSGKLAKVNRQADAAAVKRVLKSDRISKKSATWGAEAVKMGADVTGKRSSSAIIQELVNQKSFVEIPKGRLLFSKSVEIPLRPGRKAVLSGAGKNQTEIITTGNFPAFTTREETGIAKMYPKSLQKAQTVLEDFTLNGRNAAAYGEKVTTTGYGSDVEAPGGIVTGGQTSKGQVMIRKNLTYRNFSDAGIIIGTGALDMDAVGSWDGNDQCRFINCTFENCGYGIFNNNGMVDKQVFYNCTFTDLSKGGLYVTSSHMFEASSIVGCSFNNIDGAGVYMGHNPGPGYHPGPATLQDCEFIECGNASTAAVEWSYMRQGLVVNNKIVIKTKPFKYAFRGTGQIIQGLYVDVNKSNMANGGAAIALRHPRRSFNNRLPGNYVVNCYANAPLIFIDDIASFEKAAMENRDSEGVMDYPYAFSHILYNSKFDDGSQSYDYGMIVTEKNGSVKQAIAIEGEVSDHRNVIAPVTKSQRNQQQYILYDIRGRRIGAMSNKKVRNVARGVYQLYSPNGEQSLRKLIVK